MTQAREEQYKCKHARRGSFPPSIVRSIKGERALLSHSFSPPKKMFFGPKSPIYNSKFALQILLREKGYSSPIFLPSIVAHYFPSPTNNSIFRRFRRLSRRFTNVTTTIMLLSTTAISSTALSKVCSSMILTICNHFRKPRRNFLLCFLQQF